MEARPSEGTCFNAAPWRGAAALVLCSALSGCGVIFNGSTQRVMVRSIPESGAATFAGHELVTPGEVTISRSLPLAVLRIARGGYQPACEVVEASRNRLFIVLDAVPLAIPLLVDIAAGTLREFPDEVYLTREPLPPGTPARPVPPDQAVLDAWERSGRRVNLCNPYLEDTRSR